MLSTTSIVLLALLLGAPALAAAQDGATDVYLNATGITAIGAAGDRTVAGTLTLTGCVWQDLGPADLATDYVLHGSDGDDTIQLVSVAQFPFCNRVLAPMNQNGHSFRVHGGAGNDTIYGGGSAPFPGNPNWIFGDDGDDVLYVARGGSTADGGPGNDLIYGSGSPADVLIGGPGADVLCELPGATARSIDGGDGLDVSCTADASEGVQHVELRSCVPCLLPG